MKRRLAILFFACLSLGWLCCAGYAPAADRDVRTALPAGYNAAAEQAFEAMRDGMSLYEPPMQVRIPASAQARITPGAVCEFVTRTAATFPMWSPEPPCTEPPLTALPEGLRSVFGLRKIIV